MLSQLFHNSLVLLATGPRGSYRAARSGPLRWQYYHELQVAYKLAWIVGLVSDKVFRTEGQQINFVVGENLVKIKKVEELLAQLKKEGWITRVWAGKIFYPERIPGQDQELTRKRLVEEIAKRFSKIRGFGSLEGEELIRRLQSKKVWNMLVRESRGNFFQGMTHFMGSWGLYDVLLNRLAIDMAAGAILLEHKKYDVRIASTTYPEMIPDPLWVVAEKEAREKDIEEIKFALQADNPKEIPSLNIPDYQGYAEHTFVISDVHLREYHHENTEDLLRFIWMVKRLNGRLIINGDFFDIWRSGGLEKSWVNNTRVINALAKLKEVIFVAGNHDEFLSKLVYRGGILANPRWKVVESYVSPDKRIRVMHGHQLDKFCRPGSWIGRWVTKAVTRMEMSRLRRFLEKLNNLTRGAFSFLIKFFGIFFGHRLSNRLELISRLFLPTSYVLKRQERNIMEWLRSEVETAIMLDNLTLSERNPLVLVIGHLHYEGISFLLERVRRAVQREYGSKVRLIITDSWLGAEGYVGDYAVILEEKFGEQEKFLVRKEVWQRSEKVTD